VLFAYGALTRYGVPFQNTSAKQQFCNSAKGLVPPQLPSHDPHSAMPPGLTLSRFRLIPFRSPLLRESLLLSYPRGTEMTGAGFPHSDVHGSKLGRQLPVAYRSLPRPSSASGAKASTVGSLYLEFQMLVLAMEFSRVFRRGKAAPWKRNRNSPTYSREPSVGTPDNC
jgi:hypothetical protein